ncbi:MAG TPA: hypothetical protein VK784_07215 [Pseudonocardiaceae bacterium]|nr:hypothetical protein [Pseudonocardiaceae bacterium]
MGQDPAVDSFSPLAGARQGADARHAVISLRPHRIRFGWSVPWQEAGPTSTVPTTDVRALADVVRRGELSPEQRETLIDLLHSVVTAVRLAPRAQEIYLTSDTAGALGYVTGGWQPVATTYLELARTVGSGSGEHAA